MSRVPFSKDESPPLTICALKANSLACEQTNTQGQKDYVLDYDRENTYTKEAGKDLFKVKS